MRSKLSIVTHCASHLRIGAAQVLFRVYHCEFNEFSWQVKLFVDFGAYTCSYYLIFLTYFRVRVGIFDLYY